MPSDLLSGSTDQPALRRSRSVILLGSFAAFFLCTGCGGKVGARPVTEPGRSWTDPARDPDPDDAVPADAEPAVRLDAEGSQRPGNATAARPGTYHELQRGQTLYSLAHRYQVPLATLMRVNGITDPTSIRAGTPILIPAPSAGTPPEAGRSPDPGRLPLPDRSRAMTRRPGPGMGDAPVVSPLDLSWPLRGRITAGFGRRGKRSHHEGLDIDGLRGQEVLAAASGTVIRAGFAQRYGKLVVIDHGDGVTTLYAHASHLLVRPGDRVEQGEPVAEVGRTGNARGTHLHFEVRLDGRPVDPLPLLAPGDVVRAGAR